MGKCASLSSLKWSYIASPSTHRATEGVSAEGTSPSMILAKRTWRVHLRSTNVCVTASSLQKRPYTHCTTPMLQNYVAVMVAVYSTGMQALDSQACRAAQLQLASNSRDSGPATRRSPLRARGLARAAQTCNLAAVRSVAVSQWPLYRPLFYRRVLTRADLPNAAITGQI